MSDGNFNRNLLPYRNFQSGLRAGQAQMRTRALEALRELLSRLDCTDEERRLLLADFTARLDAKP